MVEVTRARRADAPYTVKRETTCVLYAFFFYNRTCIGVDGFVRRNGLRDHPGREAQAGQPAAPGPNDHVLGAIASVRRAGRTTGAAAVPRVAVGRGASRPDVRVPLGAGAAARARVARGGGAMRR